MSSIKSYSTPSSARHPALRATTTLYRRHIAIAMPGPCRSSQMVAPIVLTAPGAFRVLVVVDDRPAGARERGARIDFAPVVPTNNAAPIFHFSHPLDLRIAARGGGVHSSVGVPAHAAGCVSVVPSDGCLLRPAARARRHEVQGDQELIDELPHGLVAPSRLGHLDL